MALERDLKGMVLAAGFGTRLRPLTYLRAKPAIPLLGRPLIQYVLDRLAEANIRDTIVNLHHLPSTVIEAASRSDMRIDFSKEEPILGTAGALARVRDRLEGASIVLVNGKIYTEERLERVVEFHRRRRALVTMMVRPYWPGCPFNPVLVDGDFRVRRFARNRPDDLSHREGESETGLRPFVFTGLHILEPEVLNRIGDGFSDTVADLYPPLIAESRRVFAFVSNRCWFETSTPERYLRKSIELLRRTSRRAGANPLQRASRHRDTFCGRETATGPGVRLQGCVLWDRVVLSGAIAAVNTIFTDGVRVSAGRDFRNCIVTPRSTSLESRAAEHGARVHEGFICWPMHLTKEVVAEGETP